MEDQEILLESGTNEFEILELYLGSQSCGINALKVLKIIPYDPSTVTFVPNTHWAILGQIRLPGHHLPLVDLKKFLFEGKDLERELLDQSKRPIVLLTRINSLIHAFLVDGFERIHRVFWTHVQPPPEYLKWAQSEVTGIAPVGDHDIVMLDFESVIAKIFGDIAPDRRNPDRKLDAAQEERKKNRENVKLLVADDSMLMLNTVLSKLTDAGYVNHTAFSNGESVYQKYLELRGKALTEQQPMSDFLNMVVIDIEMPGMDGLTLCKKIKQGSPGVIVIILSSLVNEQMALKCEEVGADGNLTKKEIYKLIGLMDQLGHI